MTTYYPSPGAPRPPDPAARPFKLTTAPPPPSDYYRNDPHYTDTIDFSSTSVGRAISNLNSWRQKHDSRFSEVVSWLAASGCLPEVVAARETLDRVNQAAEAAGKRLSEAQARLSQAEDDLAKTITEGGKRLDRAGETVVAARRELEAAQVVIDAVDAVKMPAARASQTAISRIVWKQALERAERLNGPKTDDAVAWIRAQITGPGVGVRQDPLRWL